MEGPTPLPPYVRALAVPAFRWLGCSGLAVVLGSFFMGLGAVVTFPFGALVVGVSVAIGTCWLSRQLSSTPWRPDSLLLAAGGVVTALSLSLLLASPRAYWLYFVALIVLLGAAVPLLRRGASGVAWFVALSFGFLVVPVSWLRESGASRSVRAGEATHTRWVLWLGADPNAIEQREPLLTVALSSGNVEVARALLDHGADPNGKGVSADTPALIRAVHTEKPAFVELLLERGADPNLTNAYGETALFHAARFEQVECARLLLAHGASRAHTDRLGRRAVDVARERNHPALMTLLGP